MKPSNAQSPQPQPHSPPPCPHCRNDCGTFRRIDFPQMRPTMPVTSRKDWQLRPRLPHCGRGTQRRVLPRLEIDRRAVEQVRDRLCGVTNQEVSRMRLVFVMALLPVIAGCSGGGEAKGSYPSFQDRLKAGATCEKLFGIRNAVDPKSPLIEKMNHDLREVGCYSKSSVRTDQKAQSDRSASGSPSALDSAGFTVQEYRIYREVMGTPMSVSESKALESVSRKYGVSVDEARASVNAVQKALSRNNWFGTLRFVTHLTGRVKLHNWRHAC